MSMFDEHEQHGGVNVASKLAREADYEEGYHKGYNAGAEETYTRAYDDGREFGFSQGVQWALDHAVGALLDLTREWRSLHSAITEKEETEP